MDKQLFFKYTYYSNYYNDIILKMYNQLNIISYCYGFYDKCTILIIITYNTYIMS